MAKDYLTIQTFSRSTSLSFWALRKFGFIVFAGWLPHKKDYVMKRAQYGDFVALKGGKRIRTALNTTAHHHGGYAKKPPKLYEVIGRLEKGGRPVFSRPLDERKKLVNIFWDSYFHNIPKGKGGHKEVRQNAKNIFQIPMLKGWFKHESSRYRKKKGFSRPSILTGQTAISIEAKIEKSPLESDWGMRGKKKW